MTYTDIILDALYKYFEQPLYLALIPVAVIVTFWVLSRRWVRIKEEPESLKKKIRIRKMMFFTRSILFALVLIALASPYVVREQTLKGEAFVKILVDNSTSMSVFDLNDVNKLVSALEKKIHVEVKTIASGSTSPLGDGALEHLKQDDSILLVTDGRATNGASLGDVALFANRLNSSISALSLEPRTQDSAISVSGPSKTVEDVENTFKVQVSGTQKADRHVVVQLDSETVIDKTTSETSLTFVRKLSGGYHLITAKLLDKDLFSENNVWYKIVKVVPRPKVALVGEGETPLKQFISPLYDVWQGPSVPQDLTPYYALITNNVPADKIPKDAVARLTDFVADGNGLLAFGGKNSFEKGAYKDSFYEQILPVFVSTPGKKEGDVNIVIAIDISGSTGTQWGSTGIVVDVEKALGLGVIQELRADDQVAVVAFNTQGFVVAPLKYLFEHTDLVENVKKLTHTGGTLVESGIVAGADLMKNAQGSKNIILISDGLTQVPANTENAAKLAANAGIKIYTIGVGPQTNEVLMQSIADITNGIYFKAEDASRIKIIFGKPDNEKPTEYGVAILDSNHFITQGITTKAKVFGFNEVVPKTTAKMLVAASTGEPLITAWRFGLGRAAAVSTDDGTVWAGQLLSKENSKLLTRTINWAIGDPDRKAEGLVEVKDTRVGQPTEIFVKAKQLPVSEGTVFHRTAEDTYLGVFTPEKEGFQQVLGASYAVNHLPEFDGAGIDPELENIIRSTGGKLFKPGDVDSIVKQVQAHATRTIMGRDAIRWPFIAAALVLFLLELGVRRIWRKD